MRLAAVATALFGLALVAQPVLANEEAYAFIEGVYATYEEGDGNGIPLEGPTLRDHFTNELALLIEEDAKLGEQKRMNYDPLADAEEWEISDIRITIRELTYDHVLAAVNFYSYIEARLVNVDLVKTRNGWRIDDIQVPDGRLRELFTDDPDADDEDEDEVAVDGGPANTESVSPSEKRAATLTAPVTPPVHFSGKPVPQPRPAPARAEPAMPAFVEPAALEPKLETAPAPIIDFPLETAAAPWDAPAATPPSPVETPAEPVPEASVPADTPAAPAAVPAGPATEPAKPVEATPPKPEIPAVVAPEPARKAAKPPQKETPKKKAVAPRKGKPKHAAKPKAPPPAAAPPPPPAAEKPPVPPASGAPRFSTPRVPPAAKPAKPPVQAATEKAAPKTKRPESLP